MIFRIYIFPCSHFVCIIQKLYFWRKGKAICLFIRLLYWLLLLLLLCICIHSQKIFLALIPAEGIMRKDKCSKTGEMRRKKSVSRRKAKEKNGSKLHQSFDSLLFFLIMRYNLEKNKVDNWQTIWCMYAARVCIYGFTQLSSWKHFYGDVITFIFSSFLYIRLILHFLSVYGLHGWLEGATSQDIWLRKIIRIIYCV